MRSHSWLGPAEVVDAGPQGSTTVAAAAFAALIERRPAIDAVVFSNDLLALGALFEAQRRGVAVPGRVALIGFGGLDFGRNSVPALSTITPRDARSATMSPSRSSPGSRGAPSRPAASISASS